MKMLMEMGDGDDDDVNGDDDDKDNLVLCVCVYFRHVFLWSGGSQDVRSRTRNIKPKPAHTKRL